VFCLIDHLRNSQTDWAHISRSEAFSSSTRPSCVKLRNKFAELWFVTGDLEQVQNEWPMIRNKKIKLPDISRQYFSNKEVADIFKRTNYENWRGSYRQSTAQNVILVQAFIPCVSFLSRHHTISCPHQDGVKQGDCRWTFRELVVREPVDDLLHQRFEHLLANLKSDVTKVIKRLECHCCSSRFKLSLLFCWRLDTQCTVTLCADERKDWQPVGVNPLKNRRSESNCYQSFTRPEILIIPVQKTGVIWMHLSDCL